MDDTKNMKWSCNFSFMSFKRKKFNVFPDFIFYLFCFVLNFYIISIYFCRRKHLVLNSDGFNCWNSNVVIQSFLVNNKYCIGRLKDMTLLFILKIGWRCFSNYEQNDKKSIGMDIGMDIMRYFPIIDVTLFFSAISVIFFPGWSKIH